MAVLGILKMGNKFLQSASTPVVNFSNSKLESIINDMTETMHEKGGVGIAAPQVGISQRIMIFGFNANARYPDELPVPFTVLINPEIKVISDEIIYGWEGCLSVPGLRGLVPRFNKIEYSGYDVNGISLTTMFIFSEKTYLIILTYVIYASRSTFAFAPLNRLTIEPSSIHANLKIGKNYE